MSEQLIPTVRQVVTAARQAARELAEARQASIQGKLGDSWPYPLGDWEDHL